MILYLITCINGYVRISVTGRFVERFLNICKNSGIKVWDVRHRGNELLQLNISVEDFRVLPSIARKSRTKVRIISRHGLPFVLYRHKKRKAFFIGGVVFVLMFFALTSFIWSVEVVGNEKTDAVKLTQALERYGIKEGALRYGHDLNDLQNRMMMEFGDLSWMWVRIKGTRAIVEVKEKTPAPEFVDEGAPCNIVASRDGLVTEINATQGNRMVKVGDVVKEGTLLISGITDTRYAGVRYIHSTGEIKARTWYTKTIDYPLKKINFSKTGKKISKNTINFFGFRVKLYLDDTAPFKHYEEKAVVHKLQMGKNFVLPLFFERNIFHELHKEETTFDAQSALSFAGAELYAELDKELSADSVIVNKTCKIMHESVDYITVKAEYECIEDIGKTVVITKE